LYITNSYFAPERSFIELLTAGAKREVDVRILTAGPRTDVNIVRNTGRAWYGTLLDAGVRLSNGSRRRFTRRHSWPTGSGPRSGR
jgi:cardiolipin synthase A/B